MRSFLILMIMACVLFVALDCCAQTDESQAIQPVFRSVGVGLGTQHPWDHSDTASAQQQQSLKQLRQLADKMMRQPLFAPSMLAMLDEYKNQDGYQRQRLVQAILNYPQYTVGDVLFIKKVYIASLSFHYDKYPQRVRGWLTPFAIQYHLADMILSLKKQGNLIDNPDVGLISTNPAAWLAKYAPE